MSLAGAAVPAGRAPWSFQEDFGNGIPGWISYPLAQDEGYDPSLYTTTSDGSAVLVRDVIARGQRILRVGLLRPLKFRATPSSMIELAYKLEVGGPIIQSQVTLVAADGHRYMTSIPASQGVYNVTLTGNQLSVPEAGAKIEAIVVEADVASPIPGSHNQLTMRSFEVEAERPKTLTLKAPALQISRVSGVAVAQGVFSRRIPVELVGNEGGEVSVYDGSGRELTNQVIHRGELNKFGLSQADLALGAPSQPGLWSAHVRSGEAECDFRFLVLSKIPSHPRILLTPNRLMQLRSQMNSSALLKIVRQRAAELGASLAYNPQAGENIALLSPVSVFPGLVQYFQLMESYSDAIAFNALDFQLSGNRHALETARKALNTVSQWPTWTPPWFVAHGLHTYYEVGVFTQRVALGYDLIADQLSPEEKTRIANAFWRNSIRPTLEDYFFNDRLPTASSNHMANSVGGAMAACVALAGNIPDWNGRFGSALAELIVAYENLLQGLFPGHGSEAEPAGYENFAMEGMSWGGAALQALHIHPKGLERMMRAFWWLRYAEFAPGKFLDTGDFGTDLSALSGYAWPAENAGDPALEDFYESARSSTLMGVIRLSHTGRALEEAPGLLDLVCCTRPETPSPSPPPERIFPLRGSAVLRSGWDPDSTVISIRVGPWFNHEHHDQGSFQVAAFGEKLIAEAGYADYYKDPRYADYFTQAPGHNTVVVDSDPFSQEDYDGRYWSALGRHAKFDKHVFSTGIDYLAADLAPAYRDGIELSQYRREYLFIKPDIFVVQDHLEFSSPHRCTFFLHVPPEAHVHIDHASATIQAQFASASLTAGGANHQWSFQRAPIPENAYENLDRDQVLPRETLRLDSRSATSANLSVAMRFRKPSEVAPLAAFQTASGSGFKTPNGDVVVLLRTIPASLISTVTPFGEMSSDGNLVAMARRAGVLDLFAAEAGYLRVAHQLIFSATPATAKLDVALEQSSSGITGHFECRRERSLKLFVAQSPASVTMDHQKIPLLLSGGFISIPRMPEGEHLVEIRY
jgi:hypothetical protein